MKTGVYHALLLLKNDGGVASVGAATCECAPGYVKTSKCVQT